MVEKFSDYESVGYVDKEGEFDFEIKSYELRDSSKGSAMAVFEVESAEAGKSTIYHSLTPKARWSYNNLIKCCLKLTKEEAATFELDYETIGNKLIGKHFIGSVECQTYEKEVKKPLDDGTFETATETRDSYKIVHYEPAE